jgi:hypothetical protein
VNGFKVGFNSGEMINVGLVRLELAFLIRYLYQARLRPPMCMNSSLDPSYSRYVEI